MKTEQQRILVMAHAHPDFSLGGGEIAAYNLFKAYRQDPNVEEAWFLGRADRNRGLTGAISVRRPNEYLWEQSVHDWHNMAAAHQESLTTWFADLIRALKPTIVHTHHYAHLGLEYLRVIKQVDPEIKIYMTLHEFMAICGNNGQMIKTGSFKLCNRESFDDCQRCFPQKTIEDFWLRKHRFQKYFSLVDGFVSPSEFLRQRYIEWGIAPDKIIVIENGQASETPLLPRPLQERETRNRFGFFGQINPFKGIDVLLKALHAMTPAERRRIVVEIHGANLEHQNAEFRESVDALREPLIKEGILQWIGPYQPHELRSRLSNIDWVVIPSIWWENSPMVIQEAFVAGKPVICSDIGGMAEKVKHGVNGLHVPAGSVIAWRNTFISASKDSSLWDGLHSKISPPMTFSECSSAHFKYFNG
jgi:glycosyltransferase involved in cell wall biosynthesis